VVAVVNQWNGSATALYGSVNVHVASTAGNWLIVVAGWNPGPLVNPVVQVCDDVRNYWTPITVSAVGGPTRTAAWAAPNARAAALVAVSTTAWVDGLTVTVLEVSGLPLYVNVDVVGSATATAATLISVPITATAADVVIAAATWDNVAPTYTVTGSGFTALTQTSVTNAVDGTGVDDTVLVPCWRTTSGAGAITASWTSSVAANASAVAIAMTLTATGPAQPNANWPAIQDQAAFGYQPGDPTTLPTWTDISPLVTAISTKRGRQYELDKLQAGTATFTLRNNTGSFDPTNGASPYAPNVVPYVPIRRLATWNGITYPVITAYVERWPQSWTTTRYGQSQAACVDTLAPLAAVTLPSAVGSEILQDRPYAYWPMNDSSGATSAGNQSGRTQNPLTQIVSTIGAGTATAAFGGSLGLPGDSGTGWQQQGLPLTIPAAGQPGYMLTTIDRAMPQAAAGVGVELWAQVPPPTVSVTAVSYLAALAAPSSLVAGLGPYIWFYLNDATGALGNPTVVGANGATSDTTSASMNLADGKWHHYLLWVTSAHVTLWADGAKVIDHAWAMTLSGAMSIITAGGVNLASFAGSGWNAIIAHMAIHDVLPDPSRIAAHYQAGATGFAGEGTGARSQRILSYGSWTQPRLVDSGDTAMQAAADLLGKSAPDALGDAFDTEIGLPAVDGAGAIRIRSRGFTYNRAPKWVFDELSGIPFAADIAFDFDPTFVDNKITVDRNNGGSGLAQDLTSQKKYFVRALSRTSYANADTDAVDQANWLLARYKDPHLRVTGITLDPASNPSVWPTALGVDVGDVVSVTRRPTYAPAVTGTFVIQEVAHDVSPGVWKTKLTLGPVDLPVLTCDDTTYGVLGSNVLGW
jgi:hypothetical protein